MKSAPTLAAVTVLLSLPLGAQSGTSFTNFIRQVQIDRDLPPDSWVEHDLQDIQPTGENLSPLAIDPGGARFELWTLKGTTPPVSYLLDSRYVGTFVPIAQVTIRTEDPYTTIPRTRADRPFQVDVAIDGLSTSASASDAAKSVNLLHHTQSYGTRGNGIGLDRSQARLGGQRSMGRNGSERLTFTVNSLPGANRAKVRGEERFSVFSLNDYQAPPSQLASQFIQIWPVADGTIAGIADHQHLKFALPAITFTVNDVYPGSGVYAQAYKGPPALNTTGTVLPGSAKNYHSQTVPVNHLASVSDYAAVFDSDGQWTIELLTETPFGLERLDHVTFTLDRTIEVNGGITTAE
jgi:hypothetical protein